MSKTHTKYVKCRVVIDAATPVVWVSRDELVYRRGNEPAAEGRVKYIPCDVRGNEL